MIELLQNELRVVQNRLLFFGVPSSLWLRFDARIDDCLVLG